MRGGRAQPARGLQTSSSEEPRPGAAGSAGPPHTPPSLGPPSSATAPLPASSRSQVPEAGWAAGPGALRGLLRCLGSHPTLAVAEPPPLRLCSCGAGGLSLPGTEEPGAPRPWAPPAPTPQPWPGSAIVQPPPEPACGRDPGSGPRPGGREGRGCENLLGAPWGARMSGAGRRHLPTSDRAGDWNLGHAPDLT